MPLARRFFDIGLVCAVICGAIATSVLAQDTEVGFGARDHDSAAPVEITSDKLDISEQANQAVFSGSVIMIQDQMRLAAERLTADYSDVAGEIDRILAEGNVIFISADDAAEADTALYVIGAESVVLTGNVLLTRGRNAISGARANIDMKTGKARMSGRVRTVILPENAQNSQKVNK